MNNENNQIQPPQYANPVNNFVQPIPPTNSPIEPPESKKKSAKFIVITAVILFVILIIGVIFVSRFLFNKTQNFVVENFNEIIDFDLQNGDEIVSYEDENEYADELPNIEKQPFRVLTSGVAFEERRGTINLLSNDTEIGDIIKAFPLKIGENSSYNKNFDGEFVAFSGYVILLDFEGGIIPTGNIALSKNSNANEIEEANVLVYNSGNIRPTNGWNINVGDYITIIGEYDGYWTEEGDFVALNLVFLAEQVD